MLRTYYIDTIIMMTICSNINFSAVLPFFCWCPHYQDWPIIWSPLVYHALLPNVMQSVKEHSVISIHTMHWIYCKTSELDFSVSLYTIHVQSILVHFSLPFCKSLFLSILLNRRDLAVYSLTKWIWSSSCVCFLLNLVHLNYLKLFSGFFSDMTNNAK